MKGASLLTPSPISGEGWDGGFFTPLPLTPSRKGRGNLSFCSLPHFEGRFGVGDFFLPSP